MNKIRNEKRRKRERREKLLCSPVYIQVQSRFSIAYVFFLLFMLDKRFSLFLCYHFLLALLLVDVHFFFSKRKTNTYNTIYCAYSIGNCRKSRMKTTFNLPVDLFPCWISFIQRDEIHLKRHDAFKCVPSFNEDHHHQADWIAEKNLTQVEWCRFKCHQPIFNFSDIIIFFLFFFEIPFDFRF